MEDVPYHCTTQGTTLAEVHGTQFQHKPGSVEDMGGAEHHVLAH